MAMHMRRWAMAAAGLLWATVAAAEPWEALPEPQPTVDPARIEVVELFWYGCSHCYDLEPALTRWLAGKPDDVVFVRIPAVFSDRWVPLARAYYVMQTLKLGNDVHRALFDAIHKEQRALVDEASLSKFFAEHGVDTALFKRTYESFAVDAQLRQAQQSTRAYRITGVPAVVVNGKYLTSVSAAGGDEALIGVINDLVARERTVSKSAPKPKPKP